MRVGRRFRVGIFPLIANGSLFGEHASLRAFWVYTSFCGLKLLVQPAA